MIVTCPDCDTSFQLDESRIPNKGIRVRCSRCKHAFHLAHPSATEGEAVDEIAQDAASSGGVSAPSVTQDLVEPGADHAAEPERPRDQINNEDDAEWEFNQDIPSVDEESSRAASDLFGTLDRGAPSGLDLASDEPAASEPGGAGEPIGATPDPAATRADAPAPPIATRTEAPAARMPAPAAEPGGDAVPGLDVDASGGIGAGGGDAEGDGASAFGSVDDFSSLMDDDPLDAMGAPEADDTADELRAQAAEQASTYAAEGQADDLGDPSDWDFFDGDAPPAAAPRAATPLARVGKRPVGSAADELARDWQAVAVADPTRKGRIVQLVESAGRIAGWTFVIVGFGIGLMSGLWTTAESFVAGERVTPVGPLEAVDMRAQWVDTARAGRLLVVSGGLRNPTRRSAILPGPLEIALLDRLGQPLDRPPVSAGAPLQERQLRELPESVLTRLRTQAARELQGASVPAGGLLPFEVVVFDPPAAGLRFEARLADGGRLSLPEPASLAEPVKASDTTGDESGTGAETGAGSSAETGAEAGFDPGAEASAASDEGLDGDLGLDPTGTVRADGAAASDSAAAPGPAPNAPAAPAAPGYDNPYGEEAGTSLQDL